MNCLYEICMDLCLPCPNLIAVFSLALYPGCLKLHSLCMHVILGNHITHCFRSVSYTTRLNLPCWIPAAKKQARYFRQQRRQLEPVQGQSIICFASPVRTIAFQQLRNSNCTAMCFQNNYGECNRKCCTCADSTYQAKFFLPWVQSSHVISSQEKIGSVKSERLVQ